MSTQRPPTAPGASIDLPDRGAGSEAPIAPDIITRLFIEEQPRLWRSVRRRLGDAEEAADIVQDAFARLVQARPRDVLRAPRAYLQRVVTNLLRDRAKSGRARFMDGVVDLTEDRQPVSPPEQTWAIEADELMARYRASVASLSPRTREVFLLHRVDELRYRDIAERLDISVATVEYHMARALMLLDEMLNG